MPTRRGLLLSAGLLAGSWASLRPKAVWAGARRDLFAAAWMRDGLAGFSVLDGDGTILRDVALPDRGHDVAADRTGRWIVAFARRPGRFAVAVDRTGDSAPIAFATPPDRHFFGHGVFSPDGALLYATENDFDAAAGVIGIYDATAGFVRIGEFPTFGMDPHELLLLGDGRTLAIANGGIETHPDYGRAKLNLSTMQPCVVFIDRENGTL
ncbi:MAG TPA: DUF1513 domain-containing protein, partial [Rhizobiaceae bacterium]|nr:DUF1513 domain-containing protein [Rhizobiaceae bacterium]